MRVLPAKAAAWIGACVVWSVTAAWAGPPVGVGELSSLIGRHLPKPDPSTGIAALKNFEMSRPLEEGGPPTAFIIPGFEEYECGRCHQGTELVERAHARMQWVLEQLRKLMPDVKDVPVKQYIIQPYTDDLLKEGQLAHATFDTIRISPATILIDEKAYGRATHLHETLHLSQPFLGHVNELEAYGLNVRTDPRFLILNYPYFEEVMRAFFVPDLDPILNDYFARAVKEDSHVPREVQWYLNEFDDDALARLADGVKGMTPVLEEASRLYRAQPLEAAYWSARTGVRSLLLDLAAARLLDLPEAPVTGERFRRAMDIFDLQMRKDDNTRLGYVIDRKKESQMHLKHGMNIQEPRARSVLYFHYLKRRFVDDGGRVDLSVPDRARDDFRNFVDKQLEGIEKLLEVSGMTEVEQQAGHQLVEQIKQKNLPAGNPPGDR